MPSPAQLKLIEELLQLREFKVIDYTTQEEVGIMIRIVNRKKKAVCPKCGTISEKVQQNHEFLVRDLPMGEQQVYLKVNRRQFECATCEKPFSENLKLVSSRRSYTQRLAEQIVERVLSSNIKTLAGQNNISEDIVQRMLKDLAEEKIGEKPKNLKKLGLDEIALVKGQGNYCAVLVDLEQHKLIGLLPSRKQEALRKYWETWEEEILQALEVVSIDLWKAYRSLIQKLMPQAEIIADRFHIMKAVNLELNNQRKTVKRQFSTAKSKSRSAKIIQLLKRSK